MNKINNFISRIKETREVFKKHIGDYLSWTRGAKSILRKLLEDLEQRINAAKKKKTKQKADRMTAHLNTYKNLDDNLTNLEESIKRNLYLFKTCFPLVTQSIQQNVDMILAQAEPDPQFVKKVTEAFAQFYSLKKNQTTVVSYADEFHLELVVLPFLQPDAP